MLLRMTSAKQISAEDAEHAADGGADQALQAHHPQPPFEHDDGGADQQADGGIQVRGQVKGMDERADNTDNKNKQKAYKYDVHE